MRIRVRRYNTSKASVSSCKGHQTSSPVLAGKASESVMTVDAQLRCSDFWCVAQEKHINGSAVERRRLRSTRTEWVLQSPRFISDEIEKTILWLEWCDRQNTTLLNEYTLQVRILSPAHLIRANTQI